MTELALPWIAPEDDILRELWGRERAVDIAQRLGRTRNAIIGRAHRLGLAPLRKPRKPGARPPAKPITTPPPVVRSPEEPSPMPAPTPAAMPRRTSPDAVIRCEGVSLSRVAAGECRWPIGDKPFRFCGAPIAHRFYSWCSAHTAIGTVDRRRL